MVEKMYLVSDFVNTPLENSWKEIETILREISFLFLRFRLQFAAMSLRWQLEILETSSFWYKTEDGGKILSNETNCTSRKATTERKLVEWKSENLWNQGWRRRFADCAQADQ